VLVILNGPINSGKSTLAKLLTNKISNMVNVEVDAIRELVPIQGSIGWEISFKAAVALVKCFLKEELDIVFTYHISKKDYEYIINEVRDMNVKVYAFTLKPTKESILSKSRKRLLSNYLVNKLQATYDSKKYDGSYGKIIDSTNQTPEQTLTEILKMINS
jgi:predicted kinase